MSSFKSIHILAVLGAREWIRLKFFYLVIFVSLLFIGFSHLLSSLTFAVQERLLFDFGLGGLELGLLLISSLIGSHAIQREVDRKTLLVILARPLPRWHIIMGAWGTLLILNLIFTFGFSLALILSSESIQLFGGFAISAFSCLLKALVISSFSLAMGLIVRPILALGAGFCYWVLCYSVPDLQYFVRRLQDSQMQKMTEVLDIIVPRFYLFNWKSYYFIVNPPNFSDLTWATAHCLAWTLFWLLVASHFFKRKEIV